MVVLNIYVRQLINEENSSFFKNSISYKLKNEGRNLKYVKSEISQDYSQNPAWGKLGKWDLWSTNEGDPSFIGSLGSFCRYQRFLSCLCCFWSAQCNFFSSLLHTTLVKKVSNFPVPMQPGCHWRNSPWVRNDSNYSRPGRVWSVTSQLGTGKRLTFFTV